MFLVRLPEFTGWLLLRLRRNVRGCDQRGKLERAAATMLRGGGGRARLHRSRLMRLDTGGQGVAPITSYVTHLTRNT